MAYGRVLLVLLAVVAAGASFRCGGGVPSPEPATPTASPALGPPPALLGLEPFYQKYLDAGGIPVVSSSDVSDETLVRVAATLDEMLVQRPEMREAIVASGGRVAVLAADEPATSLPEYRYRAREELEAYDPRIARLVQEVFGDATLSSSCYLGAYPDTEVRRYVVQGVVLGPDDVPLSGIVVWAFLGEDVAGASRTDADGSFTLLASDGEMNIAFCTREGEEVAFGGWHGGEDGLAPRREEATPLVVRGESVTGMVIKLPADHGITEC